MAVAAVISWKPGKAYCRVQKKMFSCQGTVFDSTEEVKALLQAHDFGDLVFFQAIFKDVGHITKVEEPKEVTGSFFYCYTGQKN